MGSILGSSGSVTQDLQASWLQLRIAAIAALSSAARGRRQGLSTGAGSVASTVVHVVRTAISRDWQRVVAGDPAYPALLASGICCSSWLRGRYLYVRREQCLATWARNGAFCTVADARGTVSISVGQSLVRPLFLHGLKGFLPGRP